MHLENAGVVHRRRGIGTVLIGVVHPSVGLERLERLEDLAERQGWTCGTADVEFLSADADELVAARLEVPAGSPVTLVTRTKTRDGEPLAVMESWVPEAALDRSALESSFQDSVTGLMLSRLPLRYARAEVSASVCPERCLQRLELEPGAPVLVLEEIFIGDGEQRLAYNENFFIPERIRLETIRKPPRVNHG
jgi:DNA-binding GntR family transcriptional regulator